MLNAEKTAFSQQSATDYVLMLPQEKKMALCDICGSFLVANDVAERTQTHVTGKQHIGYGMIRDFLSEFKVRKLGNQFESNITSVVTSYNMPFLSFAGQAAKEKAKEEERLAREKEAEERRKQKENNHGSRVRGSDLGGRERSRERDHGRDRSRDWGCERERSRDWSGQGSRDRGRESDRRHNYHRNGRQSDRDRYRDRSGARSRSRSPARHSHRRSRSPVLP